MKKLLKKTLLFIFCLFISATVYGKKPVFHYVHIDTDKGSFLLKLYNETPTHRDNFVKLVREGYYENLMFHRVINNFMIQGGDPDSRFAAEKQALGEGGPDYTLPAEIYDGLIHKKGAIGAARDNNPAKRSSASQFYLVQGHVYTQAGLDSLEQFRFKGKKLTPLQRETYSTIGGTPHLDSNYTVFGELIKGVEIIDSIASVETDMRDRAVKDVRMKMKVLNRREALNLEREQAGLPSKSDLLTKFFDLFSSSNY